MKNYDIDNLQEVFRQYPFKEDEVYIYFNPKTIKEDKADFWLYTSPLAMQKRLDAAVGPSNWKFTFETQSRNSEYPIMNGTLSIFDPVKREWIGKSQIGEPDPRSMWQDKNQYNNTFKRCCQAWGLGRELEDIRYATRCQLCPPNIEIDKDEENGELYVKDTNLYKVCGLSYNDEGLIQRFQIFHRSNEASSKKFVFVYNRRVEEDKEREWKELQASLPLPDHIENNPLKRTDNKVAKATLKTEASANEDVSKEPAAYEEKKEDVNTCLMTEKPKAKRGRPRKVEMEQTVKELFCDPEFVSELDLTPQKEPSSVAEEVINIEEIKVEPEETPSLDTEYEQYCSMHSDCGSPTVKKKTLGELTPALILHVFENTHDPEIKKAIIQIAERKQEVGDILLNNGYDYKCFLQ